MTQISIFDAATDFAEDKDVAAKIRDAEIKPALGRGETVVLDFSKVDLSTQSFLHALISDVLRTNGEPVLDQIEFKGCSKGVRGLIRTVVQYSLETTDEP